MDLLQADPTYKAIIEERKQIVTAMNTLRGMPGATGASIYGDVVPDAPFKKTWTDYLLSRHLLEASADPKINWFGVTGPEEPLRHWGTNRIEWSPTSDAGRVQARYTPLRGVGRPWTQNAGAENIGGPDELAQLIAEASRGAPDTITRSGLERMWRKIQASPGGGALEPRRAGMEAYYGQRVPQTLAKLINPLGGDVRQGMARGRDVKGRANREYSRLSTNRLPVSFTQFTPELRQAIQGGLKIQ
jgi:hypothetical protein